MKKHPENEDWMDDMIIELADPCSYCEDKQYCDGWEAQFCCKRCERLEIQHCEDCNPMDI